MADPDGGGEFGGEADEPGVGEALRGAGLARLRATAHIGVAGAGPLGDHALEDAGHLPGLALGEDPFPLVFLEVVYLAVGEGDAADRGGVVVDAAVGEG